MYALVSISHHLRCDSISKFCTAKGILDPLPQFIMLCAYHSSFSSKQVLCALMFEVSIEKILSSW